MLTIDIQTLSKENRNQYALIFSEGSKSLEHCLKVLWDNDLYTMACCKGHKMIEKNYNGFLYLYAYIAMEKNSKLFEYLSDEIIFDPYNVLYNFNGCECIYLYGDNKEERILKISDDVLTGKKNNKKQLKIKVNKPMSLHVKEKCINDYYLNNGFMPEEIEEINNINQKLVFLYNNSINDEDATKLLTKRYDSILYNVKNRQAK